MAPYPGRVYYGDIDRTKIDEVYLDLFSLFGTSDVTSMEEHATFFTKRLLEERLRLFAKAEAEVFFDGKSDEIWRTLFFAGMGNPRVLNPQPRESEVTKNLKN